jgi:hypothetical protein
MPEIEEVSKSSAWGCAQTIEKNLVTENKEQQEPLNQHLH